MSRAPHNGRFERGMVDINRGRQIVEMHDQGMTFAAIAEHFGIHKSNVSRSYWAVLRDVPVEAVDKHRNRVRAEHYTHLARLDDALSEAMPLVRDGQRFNDLTDIPAFVALLREKRMVLEAIAKLDGLNAPVRHDVKVSDAWLDEVEQLAAEIAGTPRSVATGSAGGAESPTGA